MSRSFTTSQVAREQVASKELEDSQVAPKESEDTQVAPKELEDSQVAPKELEDSQVAPKESEDTQVAPKELEDSQVAPKELEDSQAAPKDLEDGAPIAPLEVSSNMLYARNLPFRYDDNDIRKIFSQFGEITEINRCTYWPFSFICVLFKSTPLDLRQSGTFRGSVQITFASKDIAVAAMASLAQKPVQIGDRVVRVEYAKHNDVFDPHHILFYSDCPGDDSEIKTIFRQFSEFIVSVYRSMLFILSNYTNNSHVVSLNSE